MLRYAYICWLSIRYSAYGAGTVLANSKKTLFSGGFRIGMSYVLDKIDH